MKTAVALDTRLPLTCSRDGACCHGNAVWLSPWELARLAAATATPPARFHRERCVDGGLRLPFDGPADPRGLPACRLYAPSAGCSVHPARPLACRLYPLARERRGDAVRWVHAGPTLPCLATCPAAATLPSLSVADYLADQAIAPGAAAQDAYLDVMQALADGAFVLLLESGLAASGDRRTLPRWRALGDATPDARAAALGDRWLDLLLAPPLDLPPDGAPGPFVAAHRALLEREAQAAFAALDTADALRDASARMLGLALHLGRGLGADPTALATRWIATARAHGARG